MNKKKGSIGRGGKSGKRTKEQQSTNFEPETGNFETTKNAKGSAATEKGRILIHAK
jgi:hypothetical protein